MNRNDLPSRRPARDPLIKRIARVLMPLVVTTTTIQPLAYAAPSPSLLSQQPKFVDLAVDSNVAFIMDDSLSMEDIRLPVPANLNPGETSGGSVTVRGAATGLGTGGWSVTSPFSVERNNDWIYRSSALNPLYYNPAIRYRPWNDNGRAGTTGRFRDAEYVPLAQTASITDSSNDFRFGRTQHDRRYVGPNYTYSAPSAQRLDLLPAGNGINAGANPLPVPSYLAALRAPKGGFGGVTDNSATPRNQDLFTSPMVLANGGPQQCLSPPTPPVVTALPTTPRGSTPQPTSTRTTIDRPSDPLPTQPSTASTRGNTPQPTQARLTFGRPVAVASYGATVTTVTSTPIPTGASTASARPSQARPADTNRSITTRPSQAQDSTNRTIVARPSTPVSTSDRPFTTPPTEYRQEGNVCGTWGGWTTTQPTPKFCSDPNSEGGVRVAVIESRTAACPTGTTPIGGQCYSACPTGSSVSTTNNTQCVTNCAGTIIGSQCYSNCTSGYSVHSDPTQCISNCASGTPSGTQCLLGCPSGTTLISGQCYSACPTSPTNTTVHSNPTQCISTCPSGTTQTATQCLGVCDSAYPTAVGNTCYAACPGGSELVGSNVTQCYSLCGTGTTRNPSNPLQCLGTCPGTHPFQSGTQCYQNCPTGTRNPSNPAQCLSCPTGGSLSGTQCVQTSCPTGSTLINGQCYAACPADSNGNPTAPQGSPATQCRTTCPTGTLSSTASICRLGCPTSHPTLSGTTCYADCPTGTQLVSGDVTQCFTNCPTSFTRNSSNPLQCDGACGGTFPTRIGNLCYGACGPNFSLNGASATTTQCISNCPSGSIVNPGDNAQCLGACPAGFPTLSGTTCYADCPASFPTVNPGNVAQCQGSCPAATTQAGTECRRCPDNYSALPSGQCCANDDRSAGNCPRNNNINDPLGCVANRYYRDYDERAPARYYVFAPQSGTKLEDATTTQKQDPANYVLVEINRDKPNTPREFTKYPNREDCTGSTCSWDQEAQNFANWFTYYRTRLFSAIAVTSESLSRLKRDNNLDGLRLAYGSNNYFPNGADPFKRALDPSICPSNTTAPGCFCVLNAADPSCRISSSVAGTVDGQSSNGTIVRGVRQFTELTPPADPGAVDDRQEVFTWLFSLRAVASTPNREALDSAGRYFSRNDSQGPWIAGGTKDLNDNNKTVWSSNEQAEEHIICRRNYTIAITDGEWTRAPDVPAAPQQPLVENTGTPLNSLRTTGPTINGTGNQTYTYRPEVEVQFSTNASSSGGTLTDIAHYYWANDLRPDLINGIIPVDASTGSQGNPAFWQHMVPYLIGYGISASKDTDSTRQAIIASRSAPQSITWPAVAMEPRGPTDTQTIVTDRDTRPDPVADPIGYARRYDCQYDASSNPSGCGRVDDTFRAAMAARGDFLSAADVGKLAEGVAAAFTAIGQIEGSATALTGRSGTLQSGERLFAASFRTNIWTGRVQSFDAVEYFQGLATSTTPPSVDSKFPAAADRNILTSTTNTSGSIVGTAFPKIATEFTANLSAAQRAQLNNDFTLVEWVRGSQSREVRNGGPFRNRPSGEVMGSVVNSQPLFSKAPDAGYTSVRKPAADGSSGNAYRDFVNLNKQHRPARIFVGSNSGMLHAFDVTGDPSTNGNYMNEVFAYVPRAVYGQLPQLASPFYVHRYLVDGPIVEGDVYTGGAWRTVVVGTTGAGPKGVFALDVTQRSGSTATTMSASNVLWDVAAGDSRTNIEHLGNILQPGVIASGKDGNWYYFVGNGYESQNDKAKLLAIRISDGSIVAIDTDNAGGANKDDADVDKRPNGLGGITPVYDANRNVIAIYAGDRLGRLWKFDLSSTSAAAWSSTRLFTAADTLGNRQPISAAPRIVAHPLGGRIVVFGTGRISENTDLDDQRIQSVYGVWEKDTSSPTAVAKSSLRQFALVDQVVASTGARFRQLTGTSSLNWSTDLGWYFDLIASGSSEGERVVASPTENYGFVNVTSFEPTADNDPCKGGGRSFFYRLDVAGSFTRAPFAPTGPITGLPTNVPLNTVVGSELSTATVNQLQTVLRPVDGTTNTSTTLSVTDTANIANRTASAATNPCLGSRASALSLQGTAVSSPTMSCPVAPIRTWRELPRGPR